MNITQCSLAIVIMIYGFLQSPIAYCNESSNKLYQPFLLGMVSAAFVLHGFKYYGQTRDAKYRARAIEALKNFSSKKGLSIHNVDLIFGDIKNTAKQGKITGFTDGKRIVLDSTVLERLIACTRAGKDLHPEDKHIIAHEFGHIHHADRVEYSLWKKVLDEGDYSKSEILGDFSEASKEKTELLRYIDRAQEFYADVYALEQFSNAELYDYIRYSTACSRSPLECHLNSFQFGQLAQEILTERETGIKKPSAVAAEFFKESLANISSYELPLYLSGLLL